MNLPFEINLKDKVIVITGAGGVLCSMFAKALAETGARIALLDRNIENATMYADEISAQGHVAKAYQVDVLDQESLEKAHQEILKDLGPCDILINGAGGNKI